MYNIEKNCEVSLKINLIYENNIYNFYENLFYFFLQKLWRTLKQPKVKGLDCYQIKSKLNRLTTSSYPFR